MAVDDLPFGNLLRVVAGFERSETQAELAQLAGDLREWLRGDGTDPGRAFAAWLGQLVERMAQGEAVPAPVDLEETTMSLLERVAQWPDQWRREGMAEGRREGVVQGRREGVAQGVVQGRQESMARERALLCRQAALRFGAAAGARLESLLGATEDWDELAAVAELVVSAQSAAELADSAQRLLEHVD